MPLTNKTISTAQTLLKETQRLISNGHVCKGWTPEVNMFNAKPLTRYQALKMNIAHDQEIIDNMTTIVLILEGVKVKGYLDTDY